MQISTRSSWLSRIPGPLGQDNRIQTISLLFLHSIGFKALNFISEFLKKCSQAVWLLVACEDTTGDGAEGRRQIANYHGIKTRVILKAVFWITASIILSLLIGQLT